MAKRFWQIRGYRQFEIIVDLTVPAGCMTAAQVQDLLRCFAAKELSYDEIVGGFVRRKTKLANTLLDVRRNGPYPEFDCGLEPSFAAIVVDENGDRPAYPLPAGTLPG